MKTLIVKEGTLGGLVRITPLLRVLKGDIYWLTLADIKAVLPRRHVVHIIDINRLRKNPRRIKFDLVVNLEDSEEIAKLLTLLDAKKTIGAYWDEQEKKVVYTPESAPWFDIGFISKFKPKNAPTSWLNGRKYSNRKSYQEMIFGMLGLKFKDEEYLPPFIGRTSKTPRGAIKIAIEKRAGKKWPMKRWSHYDALKKKLQQAGLDAYYLRQRKNVADYIKDIGKCDVLVSGDTLAMHVGLALKKQLVTIFTCTSPWEVYDYGRMAKVISPLLKKGFYKRTYMKDVVEAVSLDDVLAAVLQRAKLLKRSK